MCENLDSLDEPEAKGAMIWIIGEYAERIEDAGERLESWVDTFEDETAAVQLQLLTAVVKLFLKRPDSAQDLVRRVLDLSTEGSDNPDLRDRGYVYWRLLSTNPKAAKEVVVSKKPVISDDTFRLSAPVLDSLIANIATLASVYHKPPETFVKGSKSIVFRLVDEEDRSEGSSEESDESDEYEDDDEDEEEDEDSNDEGQSEDEDDDSEEEDDSEDEDDGGVAAAVDLLDLGGVVAAPSPAAAPEPVAVASSSFPPTKRYLVLPADKGNGVQIQVSYGRRSNTAYIELAFENKAAGPLANAALQFNDNYLGIKPAGPLRLPSPIAPGGSGSAQVPLRDTDPCSDKGRLGFAQVAVKTDFGVSYFNAPLPPHIFFREDGKVAKTEFVKSWQGLAADQECKTALKAPPNDVDGIVSR